MSKQFPKSVLSALAALLLLQFQSADGGILRTMGTDLHGQLGNGSDRVEIEDALASNVTRAIAGTNAIFYIDKDGKSWARGSNIFGELGIELYQTPVYDFEPLRERYVDIFPGTACNFFLKENGDLYFAGQGTNRLFGTFSGRHRKPVKILSGVSHVHMHSQGNATVYVMEDGRALVTAPNLSGRYGFGQEISHSYPLQEPILAAQGTKKAVFAFGTALVLLLEDGTLAALGPDYAMSDDGLAAPLTIATDVADVQLAGNAVGFLKMDGSVWYWFGGQHGIDDNILQATESGAKALGGFAFVSDDDRLWQIDFERTMIEEGSTSPHDWVSLYIKEHGSNIRAYASGTGIELTVTTDDKLLASGFSVAVRGQVPTISYNAQHVIDSEVAKVAVTLGRSLYIKNDHSLWGMGSNLYRELSPSPLSSYESPLHIMDNVAQAVAASYSTLALDHDGRLWGLGEVLHYSFLKDELPPGGPYELSLIAEEVTAVDSAFSATAYIKSDGTMWLIGSGTSVAGEDDPLQQFTHPKKIADDAIAVANTGVAHFWIDSHHVLWGLGLDSVFDDEDNGNPRKLAENVHTVEGASGQRIAFYITADGSLWRFGSNQFASPEANISVLIDTDVASVVCENGFADVYYQKSDGSLWHRGSLYAFGVTMEGNSDSDTSLQVFTEETILAYAGGRFHFALVTALGSAPVISQHPQDQVITLGETAILSVEAENGYVGYRWFEGEKGDRSKPLLWTGDSKVQLTPYNTASYWFEAYNANGEVESNSAKVSVLGGFGGAYREWAKWWGIQPANAHASLDLDRDGKSNLQEFIFDLNPLSADSDLLAFRFDPNSSSFLASRRPHLATLSSIAFQLSSDLTNWSNFEGPDTNFEHHSEGWYRIDATLEDPSKHRFLRYGLVENEQ